MTQSWTLWKRTDSCWTYSCDYINGRNRQHHWTRLMRPHWTKKVSGIGQSEIGPPAFSEKPFSYPYFAGFEWLLGRSYIRKRPCRLVFCDGAISLQINSIVSGRPHLPLPFLPQHLTLLVYSGAPWFRSIEHLSSTQVDCKSAFLSTQCDAASVSSSISYPIDWTIGPGAMMSTDWCPMTTNTATDECPVDRQDSWENTPIVLCVEWTSWLLDYVKTVTSNQSYSYVVSEY